MRFLFVALLALALAGCSFNISGTQPLPAAGEYDHIPIEAAIPELVSTISMGTIRETVTVYDQTHTVVDNVYRHRLNDRLGTNYSMAEFKRLTIGNPVPVRSLVDTSNLDDLIDRGQLSRSERDMWDATVLDMRLFHSGLYLFPIIDAGEVIAWVRVSQAVPRYAGFDVSLTPSIPTGGVLVTRDGSSIQVEPDGGDLRILTLHEAPWTVRTTQWGPAVSFK